MNELERTVLNEILRTVSYIAEKVDKLEERLSPHLSETDKKEVMSLINGSLSEGRGITDSNLNGVEIKTNIHKGIEGVK